MWGGCLIRYVHFILTQKQITVPFQPHTSAIWVVRRTKCLLTCTSEFLFNSNLFVKSIVAQMSLFLLLFLSCPIWFSKLTLSFPHENVFYFTNSGGEMMRAASHSSACVLMALETLQSWNNIFLYYSIDTVIDTEGFIALSNMNCRNMNCTSTDWYHCTVMCTVLQAVRYVNTFDVLLFEMGMSSQIFLLWQTLDNLRYIQLSAFLPFIATN